MKENNNISKEELKNSYHIQRKIYEMEEKFLPEKHLLLATKKVLDIRDLRNMISKDKNKELKEIVNKQFLDSARDLIDIIYSILNDPPYCFLFENEIDLDDYIQLTMEDMVLVNGYLLELKPYNSENIDIDTIFMALDESIFHYLNCLNNEKDYTKLFEDDFIRITKNEEEEDE